MPPVHPFLIQVVPWLKPGRCGISDHGITLAKELESGFGVGTVFVTLKACSPDIEPYAVSQSTPQKLLETCDSRCNGRSGAILVHLSGYGYSADGVPAQLAAGLAQVKVSGRFRIACYFHELFAVGPPWKSAFWHSRRQQNAVRSIAELCDLAVTNSRYHADWLERQLRGRSSDLLKLLPVFSTIGEADQPVPIAERKPAMAVFGLPGTRQSAYRQLAALGDMLNDIGVSQLFDIGPAFDNPSNVKRVSVKRVGELSAAELAGVLSSCMFGFVHHLPFSLAKSSIFAGYCAQGVIPVIAQNFHGELDGLTNGLQVVSPMTAATAKAAGWEACSRAAWNWYMSHRVQLHAKEYAKWMGKSA